MKENLDLREFWRELLDKVQLSPNSECVASTLHQYYRIEITDISEDCFTLLEYYDLYCHYKIDCMHLFSV